MQDQSARFLVQGTRQNSNKGFSKTISKNLFQKPNNLAEKIEENEGKETKITEIPFLFFVSVFSQQSNERDDSKILSFENPVILLKFQG